MSVGLPGSTNVGEQLPTGQLSVVPWRRTGVKYTNNEAYFDVVEEIDAIIDKSGIPLDHLFATGSALACFATFVALTSTSPAQAPPSPQRFRELSTPA